MSRYKTFKARDISEVGQIVPKNGKLYKVIVETINGKQLLYVRNTESNIILTVKKQNVLVPIENEIFISPSLNVEAKKIRTKQFHDFRGTTVDFLDRLCPDFRNLRHMLDADMVISPTVVGSENKTNHASQEETGYENEKKIEQTIERKYGLEKTRKTDLWNIVVDEKSRCRVIKGFIQSKKTWMIVSLGLYYYLIYRIPVFIVIENKLNACDQIMGRIREIFSRYMDHIDAKEMRENFETFFKLLDVRRGKKVSEDKFRNAMTGKFPCIFIALRSEYDLAPVNSIIEEQVTKRYAMILDESDAIDTMTECAAQVELNKLKSNASVVWNVSGTVLTSLMKEDIDAGNVFVMQRPENYKGIPNFNMRKLAKQADCCDGVKDNPFEKDLNLKGYIHDFAKTKPYTVHIWGGQKHPVISLVRIGTVIEPQMKVASYVAEKYGDRITTVTYNGGCVTLRGYNLPRQSIVLADGNKSLFTNGVHTFADCQIGEVLTYLQETGTVKFPRIMILAGKMADRGITFGSANYADCMARNCVPWHLTEMYYLAAKSTDQPNLLQACRLCGIYVDNIPLTFYSNAVDDIVKAYHVQEELIERARAAEISATNERNLACRSMKDIIPTIPIAREKCPKRRFVGQKVPCRVKRVKDDSKEGGWDWRAEGRMPEKLPATFGTGGRPVQYKEDKTEEEIREIRERVDVHDDLSDTDFRDVCDKFAKWSQGHTKIARFMQSGVDPRKRYTRHEFAEICREYSIEQSHLFRRTYGNSQGYGKIFKREGNSVFMFPQLVPAFTENF